MTASQTTGTILIVDGNALIHRAFHAIPDFKSKDGTPTNAVYGFASVLHKLQEELRPSHILVCFDTPEPTFRDELFTEYRTQRAPTDENLTKQFPMVRDFLIAAGIPYYEKPGYEADDVIAVAARLARLQDLNVIILTGDKDIFQLVGDGIAVLTPAIGFSQGKLYNREQVIEKFGVPPELVPDFKALVGDPSDNYKGVKGIGPKAAVGLLNQFGSVEDVYDNLDKVEKPRTRELLEAEKDNALLSKKLAVLVDTIDGYDINIDDSLFSGYNEALRDFCDEYEFRTLERRFFKTPLTPKTIKPKPEEMPKDQLGLF